jgi:hypothetical protein
VVLAKGVKIIVAAMRYENDPDHLASLVSCVAGMAKHTYASKDIVKAGAIDILSSIMLQRAVHHELLSVTVEALRCIAEKCACKPQFEALQLRRTIATVVSCFPDDAQLCENARAAVAAALPFTGPPDEPYGREGMSTGPHAPVNDAFALNGDGPVQERLKADTHFKVCKS